MNKNDLLEAFKLYEKMIEGKIETDEDDLLLKYRLCIGLLIFFLSYSILLTIGFAVDLGIF